MSNPNDPGPRLAAWRAARKDLDPKATLQSCADEVGVKHPTWLDWENGNRSPGLEKALAIELFTNGAIKVEAWGFDVKVFETIRSVIARRDGAPTADPPRVIQPGLDPNDPEPQELGSPEWCAWNDRENARSDAMPTPINPLAAPRKVA